MNQYEFVNVRFNILKEEEKMLFEKLNPKNKGGSIKKYLKNYLLLEDENLIKKLEIESIIEEIINNKVNQINVEKESNKNIRNESEEIGIKINVGSGVRML